MAAKCKYLLVFIKLFICLFFSGVFQSYGQVYVKGADLSYRCLGSDNYELTLKLYKTCNPSSNQLSHCKLAYDPVTCQPISMDCSSADSIFVGYYSPNCGVCDNVNLTNLISVSETTIYCDSTQSTCNNGGMEGVEEWIYRDTIILPAQCNDWRFVYGNRARDLQNITNLQDIPLNRGLFVEAFLNNQADSCNNAPEFTTTPFHRGCSGQKFCYSHGIFDPDGDSLVITFVTPQARFLDSTGQGHLVEYNPRLTGAQPFTADSQIIVDTFSGGFCFSPLQQESSVLAIKVEEFRNGVKIGEVVRDFQVDVGDCNENRLPELSGVDGKSPTVYRICPGGFEACFDVFSSDADKGQNVQLSWNSTIPDATFTVDSNSSTPKGTFCWQPTQADVRKAPYLFTVTVEDEACPQKGVQSYAYLIFVDSAVSVYAGPDTTVCPGQSTAFSASSINAHEYFWVPYAGLDCSNCQEPVVSPAQTSTYYLTGRNEGGCVARDTIVVKVVDDAICYPDGKLFFPSAFTPNGDGLNDVAFVEALGLKEIELRIFNRWGELVHQTRSVTEATRVGWDGTKRGKLLDIDTYGYYIWASFTNGAVKEMSGAITIMR